MSGRTPGPPAAGGMRSLLGGDRRGLPAVEAVDVRNTLQCAVLLPRREVDQINRQRLLQDDGLFGPAVQRLLDLRGCPFRLAAKHVLRERFGLVETDASVAEVALDAVEQRLRRRVVEVDV